MASNKIARASSLVSTACFVLSCVQINPSAAQTDVAQEKGPLVYATKNVMAGSLIYASDVAKIEVNQAKIPGKAICSPLEAVGCKAKNNLRKEAVIFAHDIDFHPQLTDKQKIIAKEQLEIARKKWTAHSDVYWDKWSHSSKVNKAKNVDQ